MTAGAPTGSPPLGRRRCGPSSTRNAASPTSGCVAWPTAGADISEPESRGAPAQRAAWLLRWYPKASPPGPSFSGTFRSAARRRTVGYTIAYPPGYHPGDELPLVVMLHGYGGSHADALAGMSPAQALALTVGGRPLAPMAMVTVDGGGGYWNPHSGDNPMAMVIDELIPRCRRLGLGRPPRRIAALTFS